MSSDPSQALPGRGQMKTDELEVEKLRREVVRLRAERDILKNAAAFFVKEVR
jgi:transposase